MKESELERKFTDYCKQHNLLVRKFTSPSQRGVTDRIVINEHGVVAFIELKAPGKKPTPLQLLEARRLKERGCLHWIVDSELSMCQILGWLRSARKDSWVPSELL